MRFLPAALLLLLPVAASATPVTFDFRAKTDSPYADPLDLRVLLTYDTDKNQDLLPDDPTYGEYNAVQSVDVYMNGRLFAGSNFDDIIIHDAFYIPEDETERSHFHEAFRTGALLTAYDNGEQFKMAIDSIWEGSGTPAGNWVGDGLITDAPARTPFETFFFFSDPSTGQRVATAQLDYRGSWTKVPEPGVLSLLAVGFAGLVLFRRRRVRSLSVSV